MQRSLTSSISGVLVSLALITAGSASAAVPPSAFVRIEGASATLLPQTLVQTTTATKIKGKACSGSSAAGALQLATGGGWAGSYSASFKDYLVGTILGETPTGNNFWSLWINGRSSSTGGCGTTLHPGDHELWFDCQVDANFNCTNNPLALRAPATARIGRPVKVTVTQLDGSGHSSAIAGAAVSGAGVPAVSTANGTATIVPHQAGIVTLQAERSGATPSDPVFVCVYAHRASECNTGLHGPAVHVTGIQEHEVFARGPRELRGSAGPDPSGLTDVSLSLLRRAPGGRCFYYDGTRGAWHASKCNTGAGTPSFSVGANASWSYLLPAALPAGSYRLDVVARDGSGRATRIVTGISGLDFSVKGGLHR